MVDDRSTLEKAFEAVAIDDEGRACKDIPDSACNDQPGNFFTHVGSLSLSKLADGLIDPKLVLSWLMTSLGAPAYLVGLLVPVRESGALLPQLFTAGTIREMQLRKYAWAVGAGVQGLAALGLFASALMLEGASAGWAMLGCLAILALARSVCSVSYKDVLGKTVAKSRRGTATGLASSVSAAFMIVFAVLLITDWIPRMELVLGGLALAGILWIVSAFLFLGLEEKKGATEGGGSQSALFRQHYRVLKNDRQLRTFILARACLTATALAPPFMISAASAGGQSAFEGLGFLVLASSGAALVSSAVWGRLADRSSRKVLFYAGAAGAAALAATSVSGGLGYLGAAWVLPALLLVLMVAYQGVRLGRSTHLVDMADEDTRAIYTAVSNTIIGIVLIAGSLFGVAVSLVGEIPVLAAMAALCAIGAFFAWQLEEVQAGTM